MKALRKIVNQNKSLFSFWLLLSFLSAATARNIAPVFEGLQGAEKNYSPKPGEYKVSAAADESIFGSLSPKDLDVDDVEFTYYDNYSSKKSIVFPAKQHDFAEITEHSSGYSVPLYDLYCNWKFHLS